jgi:hypothetical protein
MEFSFSFSFYFCKSCALDLAISYQDLIMAECVCGICDGCSGSGAGFSALQDFR